MSQKILPGELYVVEYGAIIRTRCPKDKITDAMLHERVVAANLAAGDFVRVQCFNHEMTAVLHFAEYLVVSRSTEMKRVEVTDRGDRQEEVRSFGVLLTQPWQSTEPVEAKPAKKAA